MIRASETLRLYFAGLCKPPWSVLGWIFAIAFAGVIVAFISRRFFFPTHHEQHTSWAETLAKRKEHIASTPWNESRPLHVFLGDSHVEFGQWYDSCAGKHAIRNCGLSMAKISDVTELITTVPDRDLESVLLLCGINNLAGGAPIESSIRDYENLLVATQKRLRPNRLFVISVFPVRALEGKMRSRAINQQVLLFNRSLSNMCSRYNATFIDLIPNIAEGSHQLRKEFTDDGLHLNAAGYRAVSAQVCKAIGSQLDHQ